MALRKKQSKVAKLLERLEKVVSGDNYGLEGLQALVEALERADREYRKTHWGQKPRTVVAVDAADPRGALALPALGKLYSVCYETKKGKDRQAVLYEHIFKKPRPLLLYAPHEKGRLLVAGGGYRVDERGIVG